MLRLITGKAGSGKTAAINREIRQAVEQRRGGRLLIVPEQYSHEAERELLRVKEGCSRYPRQIRTDVVLEAKIP